MRFMIFCVFLLFIYCVASKNNVKSLTESLGQEVIEIGVPSKDLPPGLEEEPSGEFEEEESSKQSSTTIQPITKKDIKKTTTLPETRRKIGKDIDKTDGLSQEDEEARIEKELAEIYKDTADYKADSGESTKETTSKQFEEVEKPIERSKANFKFQPDISNKEDVEHFRTSVDEINCDKRVTQMYNSEETTNSATRNVLNLGLISIISIKTMF